MRRRLRIGVPGWLVELPRESSAGRIWRNVLPLLAARAHIELVGGQPRRRRGVDVYLTDGHQGPLDVARPLVVHLHEATWADPTLRHHFEPWFLERFEAPSEDAARVAAGVITVSASSKGQIVDAYGIDPDRVFVAHNGVDHRVYRPGRTGAAQLIRAAGGDLRLPYVLFVSTVHPRKNLEAVRHAVRSLAERGTPRSLVLVAGPAPDRVDSAALVDRATAPIPGLDAPVVNLAGAPDDDVARLMCGAELLCLPSHMEGFGMSVAEAMACGTAVVVSDRGSLPEVVGDAGVVSAPDPDAVAAAVQGLVDDPERRQRLRTAAHERASRWSWEATADRWWTALTSVV